MALALGLGAGAAAAEVVPGRPDESIQQAYPIGESQTVTGAFDDSSYDDVDYLAFNVTSAHETLEFTIANTTQDCVDPNDAGCPVYATLMDGTDHQVGGDVSAAGTIATYGDTEVFDWTFSSPGTYYMLMESNGDEAPGNPSYSVRFSAPSPGGQSPSGGGGPPIVRSFKVAPRQRGAVVSARLVLGRPTAVLFATVFAPRHKPRFVARLKRRNLTAGSHRLLIRLPPFWRRRLMRSHRLPLLLKVVVSTVSGQHATVSRHLTLTPATRP